GQQPGLHPDPRPDAPAGRAPRSGQLERVHVCRRVRVRLLRAGAGGRGLGRERHLAAGAGAYRPGVRDRDRAGSIPPDQPAAPDAAGGVSISVRKTSRPTRTSAWARAARPSRCALAIAITWAEKVT